MNVLELVGLDSFELSPGHLLRRATREEIAFIKGAIPSIGGWIPGALTAVWECPWPIKGIVHALPENEWRYFVVEFSGWNTDLARIQDACDIAPLELEIGFTMLAAAESGFGFQVHPGRAFNVLQEAKFSNPAFFKPFTEQDLKAIAALCTALKQHDKTLIDVNALTTRIGQLKALPHSSPLRVLGYFAILESILTHSPKQTDPYDSITRQIKKKLKLLDRRMSVPIDYSTFSNKNIEEIWGAMYSYRSKLAHGGTVEFKRDLKILGNHERVLTLVHETVRALARQAFVEPQLMIDLREC